MSAVERRAAHEDLLRDYAQLVPQSWASGVIAAGSEAVDRSVDREVVWDAIASLRNIDLNRWRVWPEVADAVRAARRAALGVDAALVRAIRQERAS